MIIYTKGGTLRLNKAKAHSPSLREVGLDPITENRFHSLLNSEIRSQGKDNVIRYQLLSLTSNVNRANLRG